MEKEFSKETKDAIQAERVARVAAYEKVFNFIKQVLDEVGTIEFDTSNYDEESFVITYYGRHEILGGSLAYSVYKRESNGKVYYEIDSEYGSEYINDLPYDELLTTAEAIYAHIWNEHEEQEEAEARSRKVYVVWDTDGVRIEEEDLPRTVAIPDDLEDEEVADWLSDEYDFLVISWKYVD